MKIPGLNLELVNKSDYDKFVSKVNDLSYTMMRANMDITETAGYEGIRTPYYPFALRSLYDLAYYSDVLQTIMMALKKEIFRSGIVIEDKFVQKCTNPDCGKEFQHKIEETICDKCGSPLKEPDTEQKESFEKFKEVINENKQTLEDVFEQIEDDLNITDDGYLYLTKDYWYNPDGTVKYSQVREVLRGSPLTFKILCDMRNRPGRDQEGRELYFCPEHRDMAYNDRKVCDKCQKVMFRARFVSYITIDKRIYFSEDECFHVSKFHPSLTYGFPPIYAVWQKTVTLMMQDKYMKEYYTKQRPPRGLFVVHTTNVESLMKYWDALMKKYEENPHGIYPLAIEQHGTEKSNQFAEFIDFMRTLDEMQFTEVRNEFRRAIGAIYGVMPLFQADVTGAGGLNNEGLQITVTNRAVEMSQEVYTKKLIPWLCKQIGVFDYRVFLKTPETLNEKMVLEIESMKIDNAMKMRNLGFAVKQNEEGDFEFSQVELSPSMAPGTPPQPSSLPEGESNQRFSGEPESVRRSLKEVRAPKSIEREILDMSARGMRFDEIVQRIVDEHGLDKDTVWGVIRTMGMKGYQFRIGKEFKSKVNQIVDEIAKEGNINLILKETDWNDLAEFIKSNLFKYKFDKLNKRESDEVKEILLDGVLSHKTSDSIMESIENITDKLSKEEVETIIRTEDTALKNKAKEFVYNQIDPKGEHKYKWSNPLDGRTTETCKSIVDRTKNGVSLKDLKKIVDEEAKKGGFEPRDFIPHINCRSTYVRVFE